MIIYRVTDRVPVKIGDVEFFLAPLSLKQKQEIISHFRVKAGEETFDREKYAFAAVKKSVKEVHGLNLLDGTAYQLSFDSNGELTDECVEDLLSIDPDGRLRAACDRFQFTGLKNGDLEGVTIDLSRAKDVKKK